MNSFVATLFGLSIVYLIMLTTVVYGADLHGTSIPKDEVVALTRDNFGRVEPDSLMNGFFPVWAVIQLILGGIFLVVFLLGVLCYCMGFREPEQETVKEVK
ncbi:hypothetical protein I4U23_020866 [Adineta vaga]|nr:hypothetical protein I4U23_020866 [Adineta vaga]